jgi:hypothetical protein
MYNPTMSRSVKKSTVDGESNSLKTNRGSPITYFQPDQLHKVHVKWKDNRTLPESMHNFDDDPFGDDALINLTQRIEMSANDEYEPAIQSVYLRAAWRP